ncbi:MAG: class I SAM-dependent methyltransferase [Methanosphaera stadtmanae]|nr:class I SAM-dependent methyltransferase [Methanosphaera stadtmanae]
MENNKVKSAFDKAAESYDKNRTKIIPLMEIFYNTAVELTKKFENPRILDLGAVTGLLTQLLYETHQKSQFTLIDLSEEMLSIAKKRFNGLNNFKYILGDYLKTDFDGKYDVIISSLSIHHLTADEKQKLYKKIYEHLNNGGIFINADKVLGNTDKTEQMYISMENDYLEYQDITQEEREIIYERRKLDIPSTLADNLKWFDKIGFINCDVFFKYYHYLVMYAEKS